MTALELAVSLPGVTALELTIALAALLALTAAWTAFAWRWRVEREPDAWLDVEAADGHPLSLAVFRAQGERRAAEPVILCHGVSANRFNMDMDDETSLARWLAARGFDVYILELRGRGRSVRRGLRGILPTQRFDDYPSLDVPAAIETVRRRHRCERVHWAGHSMGGLVLYAHLAREVAAGRVPPVRSAVTIGSPVQVALPWWLGLGVRAAAWLPVPMCTSRVSFLIAPVVGWFAHPPLQLILNPRNVSPRRLRHAVANLVADVSAGEVAHFAAMSRGTFRSADGALDYAALAATTTPVLVIAGADDRLATPAACHAGFVALGGGAPHAYRLAGVVSGDPVDFGHGDLVIGDHAPTVVFPAIAGWLVSHDPALARLAAPASEPARMSPARV